MTGRCRRSDKMTRPQPTPAWTRTRHAALQDAGTRTFVFLLLDGLSMMSLTSAIEPLRSLNRLVGREVYRWRLASLDGAPVPASNGIPLPTEPFEHLLDEADVLLVCGGLRVQAADERRLLALLRRAKRATIVLGSLSTGTYLLARSGLLDGYRCTIHWENRPAFEDEFPDLACTGKIYEIDRDRLTCSGGTAALDMMLHLIGEAHGEELAQRVANQFHHERIRGEREDQRGGRLEHVAGLPPAMRTAIGLMQAHIEDPIAIAELARRVHLSPRQLERLFLRFEGATPARYYLALRIDRAREILLYSDRAMIDVAVAVGFASTSHFAHWFKRLQGVRPSQMRGRGAAPVLP